MSIDNSHPFRGLVAFPLTPADADGCVNTEALARLLESLAEAGVASIGLLGSTGIYAYLSRDQRRRAIEAATECLQDRVPLMVGIGALRTDQVEDIARDAEAAGADALLMAPVSYTPLTQDEVFEHYHAVTRVSGLPICVYNNPGTTHFTFGMELLERLSRLPTVQAVKMPLPADNDYAAELQHLRARTDFAIGYSGDWARLTQCWQVRTHFTVSLVECCRFLHWHSCEPGRRGMRTKQGGSTACSRHFGKHSGSLEVCASCMCSLKL
jgi:4-hydroxy-tetrahydrodipicolinate synthase